VRSLPLVSTLDGDAVTDLDRDLAAMVEQANAVAAGASAGVCAMHCTHTKTPWAHLAPHAHPRPLAVLTPHTSTAPSVV
jgi:hypothetical protein